MLRLVTDELSWEKQTTPRSLKCFGHLKDYDTTTTISSIGMALGVDRVGV